MNAVVNGLEERFTTHDGKRLRYLTGGAGPPLLLCHGFIGSAENFNDWFDVLLQRRTIIAPDLPGFGRSAPLDGGHTAPALARAALSAAAASGSERQSRPASPPMRVRNSSTLLGCVWVLRLRSRSSALVRRRPSA